MTATFNKRQLRTGSKELSPVEAKYWRMWKAACAAQNWKQSDRDLRMEVHRRTLGAPFSLTEFKPCHFDRIFPLFKLLADSIDLDAALKVVQFENHDAAQATHEPVIKLGKKYREAEPGRGIIPRRASRYEKETRADDPGERKRCVYVIGRLFRAEDIEQIKADLFSTSRPWDELDIPDLIMLRDTLCNRLGTWLTAAKKQPFPEKLIGIEVAGGKGPSGLISNKEIIKRLLKHGIPVAITSRKHLAERLDAIMAPGLFDEEDPF
jgi:hypothetical protein